MRGDPAEGWQISEGIAFYTTIAKCEEMPGGCEKSIVMTATCRIAKASETIRGDTDYHFNNKTVFQMP